MSSAAKSDRSAAPHTPEWAGDPGTSALAMPSGPKTERATQRRSGIPVASSTMPPMTSKPAFE